MNWVAFGALLAGVVNTLAALASNWLEARRTSAIRRAEKAERTHAQLVKGILARRGLERRIDGGGVRDPESENDRYRRD
jgi:hypothetical protein